MEINLSDDSDLLDDESDEEVVAKKVSSSKSAGKTSEKHAVSSSANDECELHVDNTTADAKLKECASKTEERESTQPDSHTGDHEKEGKAATTNSQHASAGKSTSAAALERKSQLPPLVPGSWVAVGLHLTQTVYDVRWQDGSLERGIAASDLLPMYFNIDEHDFFPGTLVSLKSCKLFVFVFASFYPRRTFVFSRMPMYRFQCQFGILRDN